MTPRSRRGGPDEAAPDRAAVVVGMLRSAGETLAVAESCTGGGLGQEITSVPGASATFWGGVIAYDNAAKLSLLSVARETLDAHGAVSERTAEEMAAGVVRLSNATWAVATTGLAGPAGGTDDKPVGTVCIAVAGPIRLCRTYLLPGGRQEVRRQTIARALELLEEALESR